MSLSICRRLWRLLLGLLAILIVIMSVIWTFVPRYVESERNIILPLTAPTISERARLLHETITIADMHIDSLLWSRDLTDHDTIGHADIPRLQAGNVALQMFTTITKTPENQNYQGNSADTDRISALALVQRWPIRTWDNLTERALYQAERLYAFSEASEGQFRVITTKTELQSLLWDRQQNTMLVGGMLGIEGAHALSNNINNLDRFYKAGFRMMGLQHFFDNELGGSLHGIEKGGLTEFGRQVVERMNELSMVIDVSHSSTKVVEDVLTLSTQPIVLSHTGVFSHCQNNRNIPDNLLRQIAGKGGLIAIGYWEAAVCDDTPAGIAKAIDAAVKLVGIDHVALGSDFDGAVATRFDTSELIYLTQSLIDLGYNDSDIAQVMGGNMVRFFAQVLQ